MKKTIKVLVSLLLVILILASIGWYLFEYDPGFTRDLLLRQAHRFEQQGRNSAAVWLYNLAYHQADQDASVAIELAEYYKSIGNYTKAEYTLSKAIEDGGGVELYVALCKTFVEQNKLRDAVSMLDKITDPAIKGQLDALRPAAPVATTNSGHYSQYITLDFLDTDGDIYVIFSGDYPSVETDFFTDPVKLSGGETTVHAVAVNEDGLVSPMAEYYYTISKVVEEVRFADEAFDAAIRELLGVDGETTIFSNHLWEIKEFTIPSAAVSCEDLLWMPNLESLSMADCAFDGLQLLENMKQLHTLSITDSVVSAKDLLVIAALPKLEKLTLSGCYLSSITNLSQAIGLTYLDLSRNSIRDISPLSGFTKLEYLDLGENAVIKLDAISGLTALQTLDVSYNSLSSTAPVSSLVNLTHLDVSANDLFSLEGIDSLVELTWFAASSNHLISIDILEPCVKLQTLLVAHNSILNLQVLVSHTDLQYLDFSHNAVSSLPKFSADSNLIVINGGYNSLTSLDNLAVLQKLEFIYMDYNSGIKKVDKLTACSSLKLINIYGTSVKNVSKLTALGIIVNFKPK